MCTGLHLTKLTHTHILTDEVPWGRLPQLCMQESFRKTNGENTATHRDTGYADSHSLKLTHSPQFKVKQPYTDRQIHSLHTQDALLY